jgi:hypothetical protein
MSCCGHKRGQAALGGTVVALTRAPRPISSAALYQYTGATAMTVTGPISGATYRFGQPGAKVQIDPRDVSSLAGLPNLHRLG